MVTMVGLNLRGFGRIFVAYATEAASFQTAQMNTGKWISPEGKIALPLIILAALCCLEQFFHPVDYFPRLSDLCLMVLSFPLGWFAWWLAESSARLAEPDPSPIASTVVFVAGFFGTAINIYLIAWCITSYFRKRHEKPQVTVGEDELRRLLAEHHKNSG